MQEAKNPEISIVVPVYNEEGNIIPMFERLESVCLEINLPFEIVFVNDGSKDLTLSIVKGLAKNKPCVKFIDFSRNFGHQVAVTAGLEYCKGKAIVIIDADLQDPPELISEMYNKYKEGFEVVYAKRNKRKGENLLKLWTAKMFYRVLAKMTSISIPVDTGDFRLIDRKVVDVLNEMPERHKFLRGQISWIGFNQTYITYNRDKRNAGKTGYTYKKMISFALDGITSFSNFPLKFATVAGFTVSGIAFLVMIYALYGRFILKEYVPGWASLIMSILFIGEIQLLTIGIIGEYISRMNDNIRERPLYIVKETNIE